MAIVLLFSTLVFSYGSNQLPTIAFTSDVYRATDKGTFPSLEEILGLRKDTNDAYSKFFCLHFLKPMVTDKIWKQRCHASLLSHEDFVTVTDESFALLVLENNWDFWVAKGDDDEATAEDNSPKYTNEAKSSRKGKGWNDAGKLRLNELIKMVKKDRAAPHAAEFEKAFLKKQLDVKLGPSRKRRRTMMPAVTVEIAVDDDL